MIRFKCNCRATLEVPEELAGTSIQCPECHRLVDIPLLSDLAHMEADGTLRIEPPSVKHEDRDAELLRAYRPNRQDYDGTDYDLRVDFDTVLKAGADERPLEQASQLRPGVPKYDPVTGELIEPLAIKAEAPQRVLPLQPGQQVPAGAMALEYHRGQAIASSGQPLSALAVSLQLWIPANLAVWIAVLFAHAINLLFTIPMASGLAFLAILAWPPLMIIAAHFCNVVEDTGPMERDELPGMLRGMGFRDDIFMPFCNLAVSLAMVYLPAVLIWLALSAPPLRPFRLPVMLVFVLLGSFVFPAAFLTMSTSGSIVNAAPHRVLGVIRACGPGYLTLVPLWLLTLAVYGAGFWFTQVYIYNRFDALAFLLGKPTSSAFLPPLVITLPLLIAGIYFMHLFCWMLGRMYRVHHAKFPWLYQQHIRQKRFERRIPKRPGVAGAAGVAPAAPAPVQPLPPQKVGR